MNACISIEKYLHFFSAIIYVYLNRWLSEYHKYQIHFLRLVFCILVDTKKKPGRKSSRFLINYCSCYNNRPVDRYLGFSPFLPPPTSRTMFSHNNTDGVPLCLSYGLCGRPIIINQCKNCQTTFKNYIFIDQNRVLIFTFLYLHTSIISVGV